MAHVKVGCWSEGLSSTYDSDGNLSSVDNPYGPTTTYHYDFENRLTEVKRGDVTIVSYTYDALGRKESRTARGETTQYVYDGLSFNPLLELDGTLEVKAIITRGTGITGSGAKGMRSPLPHSNGREEFPRADIGDIISVICVGEERFFHYNHRGDVTALTDKEGNVVQRIAYDAFGNTISFFGTLDNPYRFSTKELDPDTGLYYFAYRHYDPQIGRFISQDPLKYIDGLNQYSFANNNPVNYMDPLA